MRRSSVLGVGLLFLSLGIAVAGGVPRDVTKYIQVLKSSTNSKDKAEAADIIGRRGQVSYRSVVDAIDPLKAALKDKDAKVRGAAAIALGRISPEAKETVPLLVTMVKEDEVLATKISAVQALGFFGPEAREALPALRELAGKYNDKKKDAAISMQIQMSIKTISGKKK